MPYHRPIPESKQRGKAGDAVPPRQFKDGLTGGSGFLGAWVQAEKMIQIALMLPSAAFIGWLAGYGLDRWLHQTWIGMAGAVFGIIAGLVGAIRMAMVYAVDPKPDGKDGDGNGEGSSTKTS